jgi:hypothetical protein
MGGSKGIPPVFLGIPNFFELIAAQIIEKNGFLPGL